MCACWCITLSAPIHLSSTEFDACFLVLRASCFVLRASCFVLRASCFVFSVQCSVFGVGCTVLYLGEEGIELQRN